MNTYKFISPQDMGLVICEIVNTRYKSIWESFKENNIQANTQLLDVYTYAYNFYFIKKALLRKYDSDTVAVVMDSALTTYQRLTENSNNAEYVKLTVHSTYRALDGIMAQNEDALLLVRCFLSDIGNDFTMSEYNVDFIYTTIELTSWLDNDYILTEYEINPYLKPVFNINHKNPTPKQENNSNINPKTIKRIAVISTIICVCLIWISVISKSDSVNNHKVDTSQFEYVCDWNNNVIHKKNCIKAKHIPKSTKTYANADTIKRLENSSENYTFCEYCLYNKE